LCDTFQVPKPFSPQLQPFGKSDDDLGELTFEVEQFSALSVRRGRSAGRSRTVRGLRVRRVLARLCFQCCLALVFCCSWFADGPSFSSGRSGTHADSLPGLRGRSVFLGSVLVVLLSLTDGLWPPVGRSACPLRTVRGTWPDSPPEVDSVVH
jgi:hypothetical protein